MFDDYITNAKSKGDGIPIFKIQGKQMDEDPNEVFPTNMPMLALRNSVLFPGVVIPINVGRTESLKAVKKAYETDKYIGVISQKNEATEHPRMEDVYKIGSVAKILKLVKLQDGSTTAIIQGRGRFELKSLYDIDGFLQGDILRLHNEDVTDELEYNALISTIRDKAKEIIEISPNIPSEAVMLINEIDSLQFLKNFIASNLNLSMDEKQAILAASDPIKKGRLVLDALNKEIQMIELKNSIDAKAKSNIEKQQREYYLNQQLKSIQEELGNNPQQENLTDYEQRAQDKKWPEHVEKAFKKEMEGLKRMSPQSAEYGVKTTYIETMLDLPWETYSEDNFDLALVNEKLDADHYGLEKVKERILEHLAILKLKGDLKAPIICLHGPPGVGKTSLGKSIAEALGRKYVRMSLGGLHDESEIRGHRKTYIGAMPGRIIKAIKNAGTSNPVIILDEIDKVGKDFRGDPSSALLEVLDPEQNSSFHDNYLELEYDLSKVLFIATANQLSSIQKPLLDRMEIIDVEGYSNEEKKAIALKHLIEKAELSHGLEKGSITFEDEALKLIIDRYTRESGVRNLSRVIAKVMRKIAKQVALGDKISLPISVADVKQYLGSEKFPKDHVDQTNPAGVATGLAWTPVGGDILYIEAVTSPGKGLLKLTGNLGDVMKESATTALSYIKSHADQLNIDPELLKDKDIHVHVPQGAIPKDGPSAGITMLSCLVSAFTGKEIKANVAMTGEITLRGKVLPVGGIKEKVLAANRAGIDTIILCERNRKDVAEINPQHIEDMKFIYVDQMSDVIEHALMN